MFVYIRSEPGLWTVGHHAPGGMGPNRDFHPESDHRSPEEAAARVHYLNGGNAAPAYHAAAEKLAAWVAEETAARGYSPLQHVRALVPVELVEGVLAAHAAAKAEGR